MSLLRSDRFPAVILLSAAAVGLVVANTAAHAPVDAAMHVYLGIPGFFELSVDHWIKDGLLAIFFFVVAVELQYELTSGELNSARKATQPAIAAAGGILVPIAVFLLFAGGTESASGWPVPTATDIAFALGVLAVFGRGLPPALRVFLLALAILDDIVGIVFIAVLFTSGVNVGMLALAAIGIVAFGILSRQLDTRARRPVAVALVVVAVLTWAFVYASGVHATIAGVALGLAMAQQPALRARHALEPWVNGLVLPLFAFSAALVVIPAVSPAQLQPAFWGIAVALPLGKLVGISLFGWVALRLGREKGTAPPLPFADLLAAGALGGIGFTVSLLLGELAFAGDALLRDEAILGVLAGSVVALVLASVLVSVRSAHYLRRARAGEPAFEDPIEKEASA
ncbi:MULTISPECIES: Na+/H+ antiporter NhaA [unclassified Microbacterium]|uniref:Na+/H+ antiporter NhaA n=1 Tax=unclassified Microbacterium TaxID=2609290 RepID=UPI000DB355B0|nr:MAG: sodium:proton antiporter [Microbacterium sp.]PZU35941.1 MAG: sodium:proton antiporter [Microbacterium sp.]